MIPSILLSNLLLVRKSKTLQNGTCFQCSPNDSNHCWPNQLRSKELRCCRFVESILRFYKNSRKCKAQWNACALLFERPARNSQQWKCQRSARWKLIFVRKCVKDFFELIFLPQKNYSHSRYGGWRGVIEIGSFKEEINVWSELYSPSGGKSKQAIIV